MKSFVVLLFVVATQAQAARCVLSVQESFRMPMGPAKVPQAALQVLKTKGYSVKLVTKRAEGMLNGRYYLETFARCSNSLLNPFVASCSASAVMTDFEQFRDVAIGNSEGAARVGEYSVPVQSAFSKLPACKDLAAN